MPESRARAACSRRRARKFDPTFPGLFVGEPPAEFVPLLLEMASDVRPENLKQQLHVIAEADQTDLLPGVAVLTLLIRASSTCARR